MATVLSGLLDLVAPPRCAACGVRAPLPWCPTCLEAAGRQRLVDPCPRCGGTCVRTGAACPLASVPVRSTVAAFAYEDVVARTVVAGKVGGHHAVWRPLGAHLGAQVAASGTPVDLVVPVPTEPGRARRRGFDHAVLLARAVGCVLERPVVRALRTRRRTPDRGRGDHRPDLPAGALRPVRDLRARHVLVVDDVLTTGATIRAASVAVATAGAAEVHVAVLARADRGPGAPRPNGGVRRVG